jgi:predicted molibdopterin-dependent oxidoreductase YjgC
MNTPIPRPGGIEQMSAGRFIRLAETARPAVQLVVDGTPVAALEGDTLLVALLGNVAHLRHSEFGDGVRSGFCLMGACQDCWVWTEDGERLRACTTVVREGLRVSTEPLEVTWPNRA